MGVVGVHIRRLAFPTLLFRYSSVITGAVHRSSSRDGA